MIVIEKKNVVIVIGLAIKTHELKKYGNKRIFIIYANALGVK